MRNKQVYSVESDGDNGDCVEFILPNAEFRMFNLSNDFQKEIGCSFDEITR